MKLLWTTVMKSPYSNIKSHKVTATKTGMKFETVDKLVLEIDRLDWLNRDWRTTKHIVGHIGAESSRRTGIETVVEWATVNGLGIDVMMCKWSVPVTVVLTVFTGDFCRLVLKPVVISRGLLLYTSCFLEYVSPVLRQIRWWWWWWWLWRWW